MVKARVGCLVDRNIHVHRTVRELERFHVTRDSGASRRAKRYARLQVNTANRSEKQSLSDVRPERENYLDARARCLAVCHQFENISIDSRDK